MESYINSNSKELNWLGSRKGDSVNWPEVAKVNSPAWDLVAKSEVRPVIAELIANSKLTKKSRVAVMLKDTTTILKHRS